MRKVVIANPPMGIYKSSDINIGQASYILKLDASARARKLLGEEVIFPSYSFNVFGRRGDSLENPRLNAKRYIKRKSLRERLSLCSSEILSDDEPEIIESIQESFRKLSEKGFVLSKGNKFYLDVPKIKRKYSSTLLENIEMLSRTKKTLLRYWEENMTEPHEISKSTQFSIPNPFWGENIGPLFTLANLWDGKYPDSDIVMAGSEKNFTNYIFLRVLTQLALRGNPNIAEIYIYPRVRFVEGMHKWDLEKLTEMEFDSDFLRATLLSLPNQGGTTSVYFNELKRAKKLVYSIGNLGKVLTVEEEEIPSEDLKRVAHFRTKRYVLDLGRELKKLSNEIRISKQGGIFEKKHEKFSKRYSHLIKKASLITPKIYEKYGFC